VLTATAAAHWLGVSDDVLLRLYKNLVLLKVVLRNVLSMMDGVR